MRKNIVFRFVALIIALSLPVILCAMLLKANNEGSSVQVYYNDPALLSKPVAKTSSVAGKVLIKLINEAKTSIDFAVYGMQGQNEIYEALKTAKKRGVSIRGVVDRDINNKSYYKDTDKLIKLVGKVKTDYAFDLKSLKSQKKYYDNPYWPKPKGFNGPSQCFGYSLDAGTAIISVQASKDPIDFEGDIMHNKFFVIDNRKVWTGSTNISDTCSGGYNANVACVVDNKVVASWYKNEFEQMYSKGLFHKEKKKSNSGKGLYVSTDKYTEVNGFFSPEDSTIENSILQLINNASNSINISVFYLTHKEIAGALIKAHHRGVKVQIILDATAAANEYTKHEILRVAGIPVKVENWGGKMHMKAACFDNFHIVVGSMNWTSAGDSSNDENTLIIKNSKLAKEYNVFFKKIWNSIPDKYLKQNPPAESADSINSLSDGIDNNFDNKVDVVAKNSPLPPYHIVPKKDGYNLIKGVINKNGYHIYVLPNNRYYFGYKVNNTDEGYFPSIEEAREAGFEKFDYYMGKSNSDSDYNNYGNGNGNGNGND